jgi:hypothetical protein
MSTFWIQTPSDQILSRLNGWAKLGENYYAALRHHLLVVVRQDPKTVSGPVQYKVDLPLGAEASQSNTKLKLVKYTVSLQQTIQSTVTSKLTTEFLSKTGVSVDTKDVSAKLDSEIQARSGQELINSLQSGLSTTRTYEIEISQEDKRSVTFVVLGPNGQSQVRPVIAHLELRRIFWDVYLYQADFLQLEHRRRWYWTDVRKTIIQGKSNPRKPLFTIQFYEPQEELSFKFDEYIPEIAEPDQIRAVLLETPCPRAVSQTPLALEDLARLAFPVSKQEVERSRRYGRDIAVAGRRGRSEAKRIKRVHPKKAAAPKAAAPKAAATKKAASPKKAAASAAKRPAAAKKSAVAKKSSASKKG